MPKTQEQITALEEAGDVPALISHLRDENHKAQWPVAEALARIGSPAIALLQENLSDVDKDVKEMVVWIFWKMQSPQGEAALIACMEDREEIVRSFAAQLMGDLGGENVVAPLIKALDDPGMHVRFAAVVSLGRLREPRAEEPLRRLLDDEVDFVRRNAKWALGEIGESGEN